MPTTVGEKPDIYFETRGKDDGEPLILIEGFTAQLVGWREGFLARLVDRGQFVVIFDNRDVGLSSQMGNDTMIDAGYSLSDMARDAFRVMDALDRPRAHVLGQSMGGMIAQRMAIEYPERVSSLTLVYTAPAIGKYRATNALSQRYNEIPRRLPREDAIAVQLEHERLCRSPEYEWDEEGVRKVILTSFDRCYSPAGQCRQYSALSRMGDNLPELQKLSVPSAIIHGRNDGLIRMDAALDIARALRNSELHVYPGMGHELVSPLWDDYANVIARTVERGRDRSE